MSEFGFMSLEEMCEAEGQVSPLRCDDCEAPAVMCCLDPRPSECKRVAFTCIEHQTGAWWFDVDETGYPTERTMLHHMAETKSLEATMMYLARLSIVMGKRDSEFRFALAKLRASRAAEPLAVPCPRCRAEVGEPCRHRGYRSVPSNISRSHIKSIHAERSALLTRAVGAVSRPPEP